MRYPACEKLEIIRLVEQSALPVRRTLAQIGILPAAFYRWYERYQTGGTEALEDRSSKPKQVWNHIPDAILSNWRWMSRSCHRGNWPRGSPIRKTILSRKLRFIAC
jgi:transposase-like protein